MGQLPSSGISISLVKRTLNSSYQDVGGLCSDEAVNMWSRWKPVNSNIPTMTIGQLKTLQYGITIPNQQGNYTAIQFATAIYNAFQASGNTDNLSVLKWTYNRPFGGSGSPYRLGDFRSYQHNAILPYDFDNENYPVGDFDVSRLGPLYTWTTGVLQDNQVPGGLLLTDIGDLYPEQFHYGAMLLDIGYYLEHGSHRAGAQSNGIYLLQCNEGYIEDDEQYIQSVGTPYYLNSGDYAYVPFLCYWTGSTTGDVWTKGIIPSSSTDIIPPCGKVLPLHNGIRLIHITAASDPNPVLIQYGYGYDGIIWSDLHNGSYYNVSSAYINNYPGLPLRFNDFNNSYVKWTNVSSFTTGPWRLNIDFYIDSDFYPGTIFYIEDVDNEVYYVRMNATGTSLTGFTFVTPNNTYNYTLSTPVSLPTASGSSCRFEIISNTSQNCTLNFYANRANTSPVFTQSLGFIQTNQKPNLVAIGTPSANVPGLRGVYLYGVELKIS